jgi:hypothetical protein
MGKQRKPQDKKKKKHRKRRNQYDTATLMHRIQLSTEELNIEKIVAQNENFLYSKSSKFDLSAYSKEPQKIVCPTTYSSLISLLKYISNAHDVLDKLDIAEEHISSVINLKRSLQALLIHGNEMVCCRVYLENYSSRKLDETQAVIVNNEDAFDSPDAHIFALILRCCIYIQYYYNFDDVTCAQEFPYILELKIISEDLKDKPIMSYNIKEVLDCYNAIGWDWHKIRYREELNLFLDFIIYRFAELIFRPGGIEEIPESMFNQNSLLLEMPGKRKGLYVPHVDVLRNQSWMYQSMWKKLDITADINQYDPEAEHLNEIPIFTQEQRKLLWSRLAVCDLDQIVVPNFRTLSLNFLIRPGERDHYINTKPNESTRVDLVIRSRVGEHELAEKWMEYLALDTIKIARNPYHFSDLELEKEKEEDEEDEYFDECICDCALIELAHFYIKSSLGKQLTHFWNYFELFEMVPDLISQLNRPYPMVIQNFNWYGVYFRGRFYSHRDACDVILHWLYLVWENSRQFDETKYFEYTSISNLNLNDYRFETCEFREVEP